MSRGLCMAAAAAVFAVAPMASGAVIFNNYNIYEVTSNPWFNPAFTIDQAMTITEIVTYHEENWIYDDAPGTIGLETESGSTIGSWQASTLTSYLGASVEWIVDTNITLQPGTYVITDSNPEHWSHNYESGYVGFAQVYGTVAVPEPTSLALLGCIAGGLMARRRNA